MAESNSVAAAPNTIKSIQIASVMEREQRKSKYAFDIRVEWSDGSISNCERSYQEFFEFHCKLLDRFPQEAGTTVGNARVIPFLPGKKIFRRSTKKLAEERRPQLDEYSKHLVSLPENISGCTFVKKFFKDDFEDSSFPEEIDLSNTKSKIY